MNKTNTYWLSAVLAVGLVAFFGGKSCGSKNDNTITSSTSEFTDAQANISPLVEPLINEDFLLLKNKYELDHRAIVTSKFVGDNKHKKKDTLDATKIIPFFDTRYIETDYRSLKNYLDSIGDPNKQYKATNIRIYFCQIDSTIKYSNTKLNVAKLKYDGQLSGAFRAIRKTTGVDTVFVGSAYDVMSLCPPDCN